MNDYTNFLWEGVKNRLEYADLEDTSSCGYSEAPAEGVFSTFSNAKGGRESLSHDHATASTRLFMDGPLTQAAEDLARGHRQFLE